MSDSYFTHSSQFCIILKIENHEFKECKCFNFVQYKIKKALLINYSVKHQLMIFSIEFPYFLHMRLAGRGQLKVGECHRRSSEVAASSTSRTPVQPGLVTAHVPEGEDGHDVVEVVAHPLHILRVVTRVETGGPTFLLEMVERLGQVVSVHNLSMRYSVGFTGVDCSASTILASDTSEKIFAKSSIVKN